MLNRAYTCIDLKSVDDDHRLIEGLATSIETDRMGDIVEPKGASFKLPLPLLWQHRADQPIGHVTKATVTKDGILVQAQIAKDTGIQWVDDAWKLIKAGLVRGLSIGFKALESERIDDTFGRRFLRWELLELSAVTIPANSAATITLVKSLDAAHAAASGTSVSTSHPAGVSASHRYTRGAMKKTIAVQIKEWEATLTAKTTERDEILDTVSETGELPDAAQTNQIDALDVSIKEINAHLVRLRAREEENKTKAIEVVGATAVDASKTRSGQSIVVKDTMPLDLQFGAMVLCKANSFLELQAGNLVSPLEIARHRYPGASTLHASLIQKTNVAGGTTTDSNWAASLLAPAQVLESAFLDFLRPLTIVDRFGTNGFPSLKRVPFNVKVQSQTSGASASWVGEGKGKPVTKFNTTDTTLLFTKIAAISVITEELARFSRPGAESLVRDELARAVVERMDMDFIDPAKAVSSGVNPASITNGLVALTSAGVSAANVLTDVQALVAPFLRLNYSVRSLVLLMPDTLALTLSLMQNSLGQDSFKGMTVNGGTLAGIPVMVSNYLASGASFGNMVICLSAENIALADDGNVSVTASREASIEMSDAPANETVTPTMSAYMVSMFQTNSIAIRAEREINWKKLRSTAVVYMDDVNWGSIGSPV